MNWINISVTDLDSEEFLGSSPVERAAWLCLLRYCFGQENGGRIVGAREWSDRKWQQIVRVTQEEVLGKCELWSWEGDDLVVWRYPQEKEELVQSQRERARENGRMGGRPAGANSKRDANNGSGNGSGNRSVKVGSKVATKGKSDGGAGARAGVGVGVGVGKKPTLVSAGNRGGIQDRNRDGNRSPKAEREEEEELELEGNRKLFPPNPPVGGVGFEVDEKAQNSSTSSSSRTIDGVGGDAHCGLGEGEGEGESLRKHELMSAKPKSMVGANGFVARFGGEEEDDDDASELDDALELGTEAGMEVDGSEGDGGRGREIGESSTSTSSSTSRSTIGSACVGEGLDFGHGEGGGGLKVPGSEMAKRIGAIMRRGPSVPWSRKEIRYFRQLGKVPMDEIELVESYYSELWPPDRRKNMLRHDLAALLNNWPGEVTRAMHCRERGQRPRYTQL